jgi:hypothetical protein
MAAVLAFDLSVMIGVLLVGPGPYPFGDFVWFWFSVCLGGMTVFVINAWAIFWTGQWLGLSAKSWGVAVLGVLARVLFFPWALVIFVILTLERLLRGMSAWIRPRDVIMLWIVIHAVCSLVYLFDARRKLLTRFREAAARHAEQAPPFWSRLFRRPRESPAQPVPNTPA